MRSLRFTQSRRLWMLLASVLMSLGLVSVPQAQEAQGPLCFDQPGVTACIAPEFRLYWERNGGLGVFGYPLEAAKQEQTPEGTFLVQYFERQRLEYHPQNPDPYKILIGRANDEVLQKEGRNWRAFATESPAPQGCRVFPETGFYVCDRFLDYWRSQGLDFGDRGVSFRESLALWGLPLSLPMEEQNIDGDTVLTQHFERARMEVHMINGAPRILLTRLGAGLVPLNMKILAINDLHGQLSTGRTVSNRPAGGAAYLAAYIKQARAEVPYSLTVHAGDIVGASPPVSALLQDEPTIDFLNKLGVDVGTIGNHEFDEGVDEMLRLLNGGAHPNTGEWGGADFPHVLANVVRESNGETLFPSYLIVNVNGARIGFTGAVLESTPEIVSQAGVAGVRFLDEAETMNAAIAEMKQRGVQAIVALVHQGATQNQQTGEVTGPLVDIVNNLDDEVDVVIGAHFHNYTDAEIDGKLVTQAFSYSTAFADIDLTIDRATRDVVAKSAEIVTTFNDAIEPDAEIAALVRGYEERVAPLVNRVIGSTTTRLESSREAGVDTSLGNLIADAQRAAMGTQIAFMNPGGIRASIDAGEITYGDLFNVQPFGNSLVKMDLTGQQILTLLNQQWQPQQDGSTTVRILQASGINYTYDESRPIGDRIVSAQVGGQPLDPAATYSVTVNSFLADGGDNFRVLREGTNRVGGPVDLEALITYIQSLPQPFTYQAEGRIVKQ